MSEPLRMTVVYEQDEDGWIVASIPAVPGAHSLDGRLEPGPRAR